MSAFLTACGARTSTTRPSIEPFLQPTVVESKYASTTDVMLDPNSTTRDLADHSGAADDAVQRCNFDKAEALKLTEVKP